MYAFGSNNTSTGRERLASLEGELRRRSIAYTPIVKQQLVPKVPPVPCLKGYTDTDDGRWRFLFEVWRRAIRECESDWLVTLEAEALLPPDFIGTLQARLTREFQSPARAQSQGRWEIVWLDERAGRGAGPPWSHGGTVGMAFRRHTWSSLASEFDPRNPAANWNGYAERRPKPKFKPQVCLAQWYLANVAAWTNLSSYRLGIVKSVG